MRYGLVALAVALTVSGHTQEAVVPNGSFEVGAGERPDGWQLSEGVGRWENEGSEGRRGVSVTGDGQGSNYWRSSDLPFTPGGVYRVSAKVKVSPGTSGGCIVTGPSFANRDFSGGTSWEERAFVFSAPDIQQGAFLRFGQWMVAGQVFFDDVRLVPVQPLHKTAEGIELGAGESIEGGKYLALLNLDYEGSNYSRCLFRNECGFNSNRWTMWNGTSVIYRHRVEGHAQRSGHVRVNVGYHQSGRLIVEASRDAEGWQPLGQVDAVGSVDADLPAELLPAEEVYVRLRCTGTQEREAEAGAGNLQIQSYEYEADLGGAVADLQGSTTFVEVLRPNPGFRLASLGDLLPGGANVVELVATKAGEKEWRAVTVTVTDERGREETAQATVGAAARDRVSVPYEVRSTGPQTIRVMVADETGAPLFVAQAGFTVADLYASDFGYLAASDDTAAVWWAEGPYKISRQRPAPETRDAVVKLEAARNEYEPVQVVLRPKRDLENVTVTVSDLDGPGNARIPASALEVDTVEYLNVKLPTDESSSEGWWPDPLPPAKAPFSARADENRPLWITVHVPKDATAGGYEGKVDLRATGWQAQVPIRLRVFDFTLPDETHLESGFGLSSYSIRQYHNLETDQELRQVFDLYLRNFAAHRITPYDPMQLDPMKVEFTGFTWWGGDVVTDEKHSGKASLKIVDEDATSPVEARTDGLTPIDSMAPYVVRWACRTTEPGQEYLVTLGSYDADGNWMSGRNIDLAGTGTGQWVTEERDISGRFAPEAKSTQVVLRPAMWTEEGSKTGTAWFDDIELAPKGGGGNLIRNPGFEDDTGDVEVKIDFTNWDRAAERAFDELHMTAFALPIQGMGGGTFASRYLGRLGPYQQGSPEYERLMTKYLTLVQDHLAEKGWLDRQYVYWFDEPEPRDYDFVRDGMALVKRCGPKLRRMLTEEPIAPLFGAVDVWCPVVPNMDPVICQERQKQGDRIWWYVCTGPKAPYTTLFIDHNAVEMRMWVWMTWKWNVQGVLIWATNYWSSPCAHPEPALQNPWEDPMSYVSGYGLPVGHIGYWGNGDGRFVYPPNREGQADKTKHLEGPVNCIRWEMLRDGMEDYEYFYLLRSLAEGSGEAEAREAMKLLAIPEEIITDKTQFARDPQPLLRHRRLVAEAIERLQ